MKESLRDRRLKLIDLYLDGSVNQEVYKEKYELIQSDLQDVKMEIRRLTEDEFDLDNIINRAVYCLENAANIWIEGDLRTRKVFQNTLFPGGLTYSKEDKFGTPLCPKGIQLLTAFKNGFWTAGWRAGIHFDSLRSLSVNSPMGSHPCQTLKTETAPGGAVFVLNGWRAGIRTPIGGSRVRSPTIGRPASRSRNYRNIVLVMSRSMHLVKYHHFP